MLLAQPKDRITQSQASPSTHREYRCSLELSCGHHRGKQFTAAVVVGHKGSFVLLHELLREHSSTAVHHDVLPNIEGWTLTVTLHSPPAV